MLWPPKCLGGTGARTASPNTSRPSDSPVVPHDTVSDHQRGGTDQNQRIGHRPIRTSSLSYGDAEALTCPPSTSNATHLTLRREPASSDQLGCVGMQPSASMQVTGQTGIVDPFADEQLSTRGRHRHRSSGDQNSTGATAPMPNFSRPRSSRTVPVPAESIQAPWLAFQGSVLTKCESDGVYPPHGHPSQITISYSIQQSYVEASPAPQQDHAEVPGQEAFTQPTVARQSFDVPPAPHPSPEISPRRSTRDRISRALRAPARLLVRVRNAAAAFMDDPELRSSSTSDQSAATTGENIPIVDAIQAP